MKPITLVCGFGRCGSSLVMQMLAAGGLPIYGDACYPSFEERRVCDLPNRHRWLKGAGGAAIKLLDPHRFTPPRGLSYRWIWLDRDPEQQARSQLKFGALMFPVGVQQDAEAVQRFARSYEIDRPRCHRLLEWLHGPMLVLRFEDILTDPQAAAERLAGFCGGLDVPTMAQAVRLRGPECLPGFLELELIREREGVADLFAAPS